MTGIDSLNVNSNLSATPMKKANAIDSRFIINQGGTSPKTLNKAIEHKAKEFNEVVKTISQVIPSEDQFILNVTPNVRPKGYFPIWVMQLFGGKNNGIILPEKFHEFKLFYQPAKSTKATFGVTATKEVYAGVDAFLRQAPGFAQKIKSSLSKEIAEAVKLIK